MTECLSGWSAIIASLCTIVLFGANIFQWLQQKNLKDLFHVHLYSIYNNMYRIAEIGGECRKEFDSVEHPVREFITVIGLINQCTGFADCVRQEVLAFSEKYLKKQIKRQHPSKPDDE